MGRPTLRVVIAVGLVAACVLAGQVVITRIFAAVLFYHFGFLAISLALLGAGAGAILIFVRPAWFSGRSLETSLSRWALALSGLLLIAPIVLVRLDYSFAGTLTAGFVVNLAVACAIATLPFFAAGVAIALAIRGYRRWVDRVYAFDLAGAALGAVAVVPLMSLLDGPRLFAHVAAVAAVAALLLARPRSLERGLAVGATALSIALPALVASTSAYYLPPDVDAPTPVADHWNPLSRVLGFPPEGDARFASLIYDRVYAPVPRTDTTDSIPDWRELGTGAQSVGYEATGPGKALIIGGGGGRDIYNALTSQQLPIDVIELNDDIRRVADEDLVEWSGAPYSRPGVRTQIGDGRSILAASDETYDQIHLGFTDTLSANSAQAFALAENNLYTVEAFGEYLDHLGPDGVLNVSRLYKLVGDEALRATVLTLAALERRGLANPEQHVVVVLGEDVLGEQYGTVLARLEPWTSAEVERLSRLADKRGSGIAFAPGEPPVAEWAELAAAPSLTDFCEGYRLDVCPPTDDKPFFFNMTRLSSLGQSPGPGYIYSIDPFRILIVTLGILLALSSLAFVVPLALGPRDQRPPTGSLVYFAAIGLGFLVLEVTLIQRFVLFLGFPTYALSVVLFALLLFTGAGSLLAGRFGTSRRPLMVALAVASGLIGASAFGLQPLLRTLVDLGFEARLVVTVLLLAPFGLTLGIAMPMGLRRLSAYHPGGVAWAWGVNGVMSVVASVLAVTVAITSGFTTATLMALACYLAALMLAGVHRWPEGVEEVEQAEDRAPAGVTG